MSTETPHIAQEIIVIWEKILSKQEIRVDDHFLELGGDSLAAALIAIEMEEHFRLEVSAADIYDNLTVSSCANYIERRLRQRE